MSAVSQFFNDTVVFRPAALTSAGVTESFICAENNLLAATDYIFQTTVSDIGTDVVIRFEGSVDNVNFFNIDFTGDTTITANGTTGYNLQNAPLKAIRCRLVSLTGGTPSVSFFVAIK
jgi:hypothetical protein